MNDLQRACANDEELPDGVMDRLQEFAAATGTTPPSQLTEGTGEDRTFSGDFLAYCHDNDCSLDWAWLGDEAVTPEVVHQARAAKREESGDTAQAIIDAMLSLGEVERLIFTYGIRALAMRAITIDDFVVKVCSMVERHRSGAGVTLDEIAALEGGAK